MKPETHPLISVSLAFLFVIAVFPSLQSQVFVRSNATGANDGSSWADAYSNLNTALSNTSSGEIWVAAGLYKPTTCDPCLDADMQLSFNIPPDVQLYGGFAGNETARNQRDYQANLTILSGDIGLPGDSTDNSYKVVLAENATASTVLDGFIIEEGNADGSFGFSSGGGLFINANPGGIGNIQVLNCTFRNNYGGGGGGVAIDCVLGGTSEALFRNCLFEGNTASLRVVSTGAAVFMQGNSGAQVRPRFVSCTFRDNFCGNDGGAISATPTGAGSVLAFEVDSCLFINNRSADRGGAIWYRMSSAGESAVVIKNSRFVGNQAGGQGGAIYARSSFDNVANDTIVNCIFSGNSTDGSNAINEGEGGAVFLRGSQGGSRNHQLINCVFERNSASERGGAIGTTSFFAAAGTCNADIINCSFYGNSTNGEGGAIHAEGMEGSNTISIANTILWRDSTASSGNEIFNNGANISLSYTNIDGGVPSGINDGGNNLDIDPEFADPESGDLHLTGCSPMINAGNNALVPPAANPDPDGDPRIHQGIVDIGAYEIGVLYVDRSATGANNGRSWANAFNDFQDALAVAGSGDQIWVARGTYHPTSCSPCLDADMQLAFQLTSGVEHYGGFNGTETELSQRDWDANPTILSGDIGIPADSTDNSYKVAIAENSSSKTIFDGFIIEEGNADGSFGFSSGGGLFIDANPGGIGNIQVLNCTFRNNYGGGGGGVAIDCVLGGTSEALFRNCLFEGNTASLRVVSTGAAVFMQGNSGAQVRPCFVSCTFRNNFCGNDGGALSATPTGAGSVLAFELDSCLFINNRSADRGGAIWYRMSSAGESAVVIKNSRFVGNQAGGQGGAIYARSSFDNIANDTIVNCIFSGNSTDGSNAINEGEGGAVFLRGSQGGARNHQLINCVFERNSASERGGAIGTTSFFAQAGTCNANIINCSFYGNSTNGDGGAIHAEGAEGDNTANIINSILWNDSANGGGNEIFSNAASLTVSFSDIEGALPAGITDGGGNLAVDPQYLDPDNGDLRISSCSPVRDTGSNTAIPIDLIDLDVDANTTEQIDVDLNGSPRLIGAKVDLGAYEWNEDPPEMTIALEGNGLSCNGLNNGTATATPEGGVPGYSFDWSNGLSTATISNLAPGTYYVTVSDAFNCVLADSIIIEDAEALFVTASKDTMICPGAQLSLSASATGGTGDFSFDWDNGLGNGNTHLVAPGLTTTYTVTVTDENDCTADTSVTVMVNEAPMPMISGSLSFCPGSTTLLDGGAFASYLWTGGTTGSTLEVSTAGAYGLTVTDENGCTGATEVVVEESTALEPSITGNLSFCAGQSTLLDAGSFAGYNWSTGDTTQAITVATAGAYSVTVNDGSGCEGEASVTVEENPNPAPEINGSLAFCTGSSTLLDGGDFASYLWTGGTTGSTLEVSTAGAYGLTVTDENGCTGATEVVVEESTALEPSIGGELSFCEGQSTLLDAGSFAGYNWSTGDTTQAITVATAGAYSVTVNDGSGCEGEASVTVEENPNPAPEISGSLAFCPGSTTLLDGGDFASYLWTGGTTGSTLEVSTAGAYGLTVTDENGCTGSTEVVVEESTVLEPSIGGELSFCEGQSTLLDAGSFAGYRWSTGDTTQAITVATAGAYSVTVDDGSGCEGEASVTVEENPNPAPEINGSLAFCTGSTTTLDGGDFASYLWTGGTTGSTLEVSTAGTYGLTVTDENGCMGAAEVVVEESTALEPSIGGESSFCAGQSTLLDAGSFADYNWSTGDTTQAITVASAGAYSVTVNDGSGCEGEASVTVATIEAPTANDDLLAIGAGDSRQVVLDLVQNDNLPASGNWEVFLLSEPAFGFATLGADGVITFSASEFDFGETVFSYELCSLDCPDACSEALVTIQLAPAIEPGEIPNGITPNGDGRNDTFVFDIINTSSPEDIPDNRLVIFNRWGDIIYEQRPYDNSWNGLNNSGQKIADGTYYYVLFLDIGQGLIIRGDVTVLGSK